MKKISHLGSIPYLFIFMAFFLTLSSCGVKGPLQPPLVLIPQKIESVKCYQQGEKIVLEWTTPLVYENGLTMSSWPVVEIWGYESFLEAGEKELLNLGSREIVKKSRLLEEKKCGENQATLTLPSTIELRWEYPLVAEKIGRELLIFLLRVKDDRGRKSSFTEPVAIIPVKPPPPVPRLRAEVQSDRIILQWDTPSFSPEKSNQKIDGFNVYKKEKDASSWQRLNSVPVPIPLFEDREIAMGKIYLYAVRSVHFIDSLERESELSETLEIEMKDVFPPPQPTGVIALTGEDRIVLSWEPSLAPDLAGYLIRRRSEESKDFELLTPKPILSTNYEDLKVEKGKSYYYAITACDQAGNESQPVEVKVRIEEEKKK
ncbi:MAG: lipoprotein [Candidatus Aminicenantes bacterium]|nr:lipoprotein [Candidatus Aminicenantes bacterium]